MSWTLVSALVLLGCGEAAYERAGSIAETTLATTEYTRQSAKTPGLVSYAGAEDVSAGLTGTLAATSSALMAATLPVDRKIVYSAEISLTIDDLEKVEPQVVALVQQAGGYVADYNTTGSPGSLRSGKWRVRIPVERFETFLADAARLGELESTSRTSQDMTEEFFDATARVKNKKVEEERLVALLEERTGKLEDVLKVETELSRVRGEIEQIEGRLRLLADLTSLTTVTLNVRERSQYQPQPPVAASFTTRLERSFQSSLTRLVNFGENLVIAVVAAAPWIPVILGGLWLAFWALRLLWRFRPWRVRAR